MNTKNITSSKSTKRRIAVGVSGSGRSLENLIAVSTSTNSSYEVVAVVASRSDIRGCEIARNNNLPLLVLSFTKNNSDATAVKLYQWLGDQKVDFVALAGFLKPFPVHPSWQDRVINIHPALLPKYGGKGMYGHFVHEAVVAAGDLQSGASVHFVNSKYDDGKVIGQVVVRLSNESTPETVAATVFAAECDLYPKVLEALCNGTLTKSSEVLRYFYEPK